MPILFQYRNIRHLLGMYITKQAEQEIYLITQHPPRRRRSPWVPFLSQGGHHEGVMLRAPTWIAAALLPLTPFLLPTGSMDTPALS